MNKREALQFLQKVTTKIEKFNWNNSSENFNYLDQEEMISWLKLFDIPVADMNSGMLPKGWLCNVNQTSFDYAEVMEKYEDVYFLLRLKASEHNGVENHRMNLKQNQRNREYYRFVLA